MIHTSILIPQRNGAHLLGKQLEAIEAAMESRQRPFEVLVIDDASRLNAARQALATLAYQRPWLRVIELDRACGTSAALNAGLAAARGQAIVALEAGCCFAEKQLHELIDHLSRADMAVGRCQRTGLAKLWHRITRIPRWLLLGLVARDPGHLFWAARREALAGLDLTRGMYRYLPSLVASRGYRVSEIPVETPRHRKLSSDGLPNPGDLLTAWWLVRRRRVCEVRELTEATLYTGVDSRRAA